MQRIITIAAALLVLQVGLVVALHFGDKGHDLLPPDTPFLEFVPDAVTTLEITSPDNNRIVLQRKDNGWILPEFFSAPANSEQVTVLLARLISLKQGFVVATSDTAAKRFKVAEDIFQHHVVLKAGDRVVGDFFVGTSPGFRQIHARKAGSTGVIAIELSTFELETGAEQWLDKNMVRIKNEDIEAIAIGNITLEKKDSGWQLEGLPEGRITDAKAAADLVNKVTGLTIQTVVKPQEAEAFFAGTPALQYTVTRKGGNKVEFRLVKAEGDYYLVKQSERDFYCKVHKLQIESLLKASRDTLMAAAQSVEHEKADAATSDQEEGENK